MCLISGENGNSYREVILTDFDVSAGSFNTDPVRELVHFKTMSVQVDWASLDATNSTFKLQQRHSSSMEWNDMTGLTFTVSTASGTQILTDYEWGSSDLRCVWTKGAVTSGTISITLIAKEN